MLKESFLLSCALLLSGCGGEAESARGPVAGQDAGLEGGDGCPKNVVAGGTCALEGGSCSGARRCVACSANAWSLQTPNCTCVSGQWACMTGDCSGLGQDTFSDPDCTKPNVAPDASLPDAEAGAGCPEDPLLEPSCASDGLQCSAPVKCTACGYESYFLYAADCTCFKGSWACMHGDCGPHAPGTYSDPSCTTLNPGADGGGGS